MTSFLTMLGIVLVFSLLRRIIPVQPAAPGEQDEPMDVLEAGYKRWNGIFLLLFFIFAPLFTFLCWKALYALGQLHPLPKYAKYLVTVDKNGYLAPALFAAIMLSGIPMDAIARWGMKENYQKYLRYAELKDGYDYRKTFTGLAIFLTVLVTGLTLLLSDFYAVFNPDEIVLNRFWSLQEKYYRYSDITAIRHVMNIRTLSGEVKEREHYRLYFKDGTYWCMNPLADPAWPQNKALETAIVRLAEQKTGKQPEEVDVIPQY